VQIPIKNEKFNLFRGLEIVELEEQELPMV